jgi:hypothetical protein
MVNTHTKRIRAAMDKESFAAFKAFCSLKEVKMEEFAGELIADYVKSELPKLISEKGYNVKTKSK